MKKKIWVTMSGFIATLLLSSSLPVNADMDGNVLDLTPSEKKKVDRPTKCKECHQAIFDTVLSLPGKHSIVVLRECKRCHLADRTKVLGLRGLGDDDWRQIEIKDYASEHLVRLRNISSNKTYFIQVDIRDRVGVVRHSKKIPFKPGDISEYWVDDRKPPILKNIGVHSINIAVLPSANIVVESDKMVKLKVNYGLSDKYGLASYSDRFKKKHMVRLKGLRSKKSYHFNVAASDPFENTTLSEDFTFSTDSPLEGKVQVKIPVDNKDLILYPPKIVSFLSDKSMSNGSASPVNESQSMAVFITSNSEVTVSLRLKEADVEGLRAPESQVHGRWGLKGRLKSGIDACVECHFGGASHPVGMRSKGKTVIPKELPTASGGVMTCATCHNPHGSKLPFLARVNFTEKLCKMCHQGNFL